VKVPGDYASVQSALSALGPMQKDATICLSGQTYGESASLSYTSNKTMMIFGPSNAKITSLSVTGTYSNVILKGFAVGTLSLSSPSPIHAMGMKLDTVTVSGPQTGSVLIDGCNIGGTSSYGVQVYRSSSSSSMPAQITIQNSWIHNATSYGVYLYAYTAGMTNVSLLNNTIQSNPNGIYCQSGVTLTYVNNIITGSTSTGVNLQSSNATFANNLLWGNQTNYSGYATDGAGYVKSDPSLDSDSPPSPQQGSPARGAGDMGRTPSKDYWGSVRSGADIGAVQGQ
jgi:hypothetical protein